MATSRNPADTPRANHEAPSRAGEVASPRTGNSRGAAVPESATTRRAPNRAVTRPASGAPTTRPSIMPSSANPSAPGSAPARSARAGTRPAHDPWTTPFSRKTDVTAVRDETNAHPRPKAPSGPAWRTPRP
nr:hypothetical protein GCM10020241_15750 [Streptoalloteichus tenebrarius]